jgi:hypothetical protein
MKKLKLAVLNDIGEVLTREELKKVFGGETSGSGSTPKIDACKGKSSGSSCSFTDSNGATSYGKCVSIYGGPLHCSDLN